MHYMANKKRVNKRKINKKINNGDNFVYRNFILSLKYLRNLKNYIFFSFILFLVASFVGFLFPGLFEEQVRKIVEELIKQTEGLGFLGLIRFIIFNNMNSSFIALFFGIFFGVVPLIITIINGYVLGFVANKVVALEGILILWKLFPHGIFELPAVLISIALGLRLGMFLFIYRGRNKKKEFWRWLKDSLRVFVFIVIPLLVIAGIVEGILIWIMG